MQKVGKHYCVSTNGLKVTRKLPKPPRIKPTIYYHLSESKVIVSVCLEITIVYLFPIGLKLTN